MKTDEPLRRRRIALGAAILLLGLGGAGSAIVTAAAPTSGIGAARAAYDRGDYETAAALLTPLAESGNAEASELLGNLFERGHGIPQDWKWAYIWYRRAAKRGRSNADARAEAIGRRLPESAKLVAEFWVSEERLSFDSAYGCASYYADKPIKANVDAFRAGATVDQMVDDIVNYSGLRRNFTVMQASVPNAAAVIEPPGGSTRYLLYNPGFMSEVEKITGSSWGPYSIMAHEIGHHLQGHTILPGGSRPAIELEADEFSGFIMYRMGSTVDEAEVAMQKYGSEAGSATHPPRSQRLSAIKAGFERARSLDPGGGVTRGQAPPLPKVEPVSQDEGSRTNRGRRIPGQSTQPQPFPMPRYASVCQTQVGACPLYVPVVAGYPCYCMTIMGTFTGTAR